MWPTMQSLSLPLLDVGSVNIGVETYIPAKQSRRFLQKKRTRSTEQSLGTCPLVLHIPTGIPWRTNILPTLSAFPGADSTATVQHSPYGRSIALRASESLILWFVILERRSRPRDERVKCRFM